MNRLSRLRIDFDTKLLAKERYALRWLFAFAQQMLDNDFYRNIHIFVDMRHDISKCYKVWHEIVDESFPHLEDKSAELDRIRISYIDYDAILEDDNMYIVFHPNNVGKPFLKNVTTVTKAGVVEEKETEVNVLEEVEAIAFNGAYHSKPVVFINPVLSATAWNVGAKEPMLLSDFSSVRKT